MVGMSLECRVMQAVPVISSRARVLEKIWQTLHLPTWGCAKSFALVFLTRFKNPICNTVARFRAELDSMKPMYLPLYGKGLQFHCVLFVVFYGEIVNAVTR